MVELAMTDEHGVSRMEPCEEAEIVPETCDVLCVNPCGILLAEDDEEFGSEPPMPHVMWRVSHVPSGRAMTRYGFESKEVAVSWSQRFWREIDVVQQGQLLRMSAEEINDLPSYDTRLWRSIQRNLINPSDIKLID